MRGPARVRARAPGWTAPEPPPEPPDDDPPLDGGTYVSEPELSELELSESSSSSSALSWLASSASRISSHAWMIWLQMSAGNVPPSTGAPLNSVSIGVFVCAWPTQTQAVKLSEPPQNQASPLLSVVPVLPHAKPPV